MAALGALLALAPAAAAQDIGNGLGTDGLTEDSLFDDETFGDGLGTGGFGELSGFDDTCIDEVGGTLDEDSIARFGDISGSADVEEDVFSTSDIEENDALLAIALANNGASDIDAELLTAGETQRTRILTTVQQADYEREDVFNAIALGLDANAAELDCVLDARTRLATTTAIERQVDLQEENVLLGIALGNSLGGDVSARDVGDFSISARSSVSFEREADLDREDVFAALLFGDGT